MQEEQAFYSNFTSLRFSETIVDELHKEIVSLGKVGKKNVKEIIPLKDEISLGKLSLFLLIIFVASAFVITSSR